MKIIEFGQHVDLKNLKKNYNPFFQFLSLSSKCMDYQLVSWSASNKQCKILSSFKLSAYDPYILKTGNKKWKKNGPLIIYLFINYFCTHFKLNLLHLFAP
jgi:hypothetical protein